MEDKKKVKPRMCAGPIEEIADPDGLETFGFGRISDIVTSKSCGPGQGHLDKLIGISISCAAFEKRLVFNVTPPEDAHLSTDHSRFHLRHRALESYNLFLANASYLDDGNVNFGETRSLVGDLYREKMGEKNAH